MTIEEFYKRRQNCGWKCEFELWSFFTLVYRGRFDPMPNKWRNLHVGTFEVRKDKVRIQVQECVR